jgi:glycerol kinase
VSTGNGHVIAIDQGTTSTRAMVFDAARRPVAQTQRELRQIFPRQGWVEHDAEEIWEATVETVKGAMADAGLAAGDIAAIGITNQRETIVLWDRATGKPLHNAIVWQDRRTAAACDALRKKGVEDLVRERTGLLLDPYFSASKLTWLLENVEGAKERAARGELAAGTIDSYLLWHLTDGKSFATDATNACRTMLFDIHKQCWDADLLDVFGIPSSLLPAIEDCAADFGETEPALFGGAIRIGGIAGDQQAATVGQACFSPGAIKSTYGTGCFAVINTGDTPVASQNRLLTTVAYRLKGKPTYAIEGSIFIAGAAVQWLRDGLGIIKQAAETEALAARAKADSAVYLVPAFTGLGAPYWDPNARGALFGMTRDTGPAEITRATLEAVAYQTRDLFVAMESDGTALPSTVRVDGGMTENAWFMQCLADTLGLAVERPPVTETTALGAAYLAGMQAGLYPAPEAMREDWQADARFEPETPDDERERRYAGWRDAFARTQSR